MAGLKLYCEFFDILSIERQDLCFLPLNLGKLSQI